VTLPWRHQDCERASLAVAGEVDFGGQSASGSAEGVIVRFVRPVGPPFSGGGGGVLVGADGGGVDLDEPVDGADRVRTGLDLLKGPGGHAVQRKATEAVPAVVRLPVGKTLTVRAAADVFLDSLGSANTLRSYGIGVGKTAECLGEARPLATVADDEVGGALEQLWGEAAVNTWNARRAAVLPAWAKRLPPPDSETPARSKMAVARLIDRRDVHLREKTLWRMLDETVARSEEILGVNIEELDLAGRRAPVKAKGAQPRTRRRGPA
jgi:hypothetical protein